MNSSNMFDDLAYTVVFKTGAQVRLDANLKEKFDIVNAPLEVHILVTNKTFKRWRGAMSMIIWW